MGMMKEVPIANADIRFMKDQKLFFVATAPLASCNRVNLSPKSGTEFAVIDDKTIGYVDFPGSGAETAAHIYENGRITIMFCSFTENPKIFRVYGKGEVVLAKDIENHPKKLCSAFGFSNFESLCEEIPSPRAIILVHATHTLTSCGYGVPQYNFIKYRRTLADKIREYSPEVILQKMEEGTSYSIDGLPGITQRICNNTPSKVSYDGMFHAAYSKPGTNHLRRLLVAMKMYYAAGYPLGWQRDVFVLLVGLLCGLLISRKSRGTK